MLRRGVVLFAGPDLGRPTTPRSGKRDDEKNNSFQSQSRLQQTSEIPTDLEQQSGGCHETTHCLLWSVAPSINGDRMQESVRAAASSATCQRRDGDRERGKRMG